jgi:hypothetical protein
MDANVRRALPGPVAPLPHNPLQKVAEFEAIAQNLLSHEEGPFWVERVAEVRLGAISGSSKGADVSPQTTPLRKFKCRHYSF